VAACVRPGILRRGTIKGAQAADYLLLGYLRPPADDVIGDTATFGPCKRR